MLPISITCRDLKYNNGLKENIIKKAEKLTLYCQKILRCNILITSLNKNKRHGQNYIVTIKLAIPGRQIAAKNQPDENIQIAIRGAFEAIRRQIEHHRKKRRHHKSLQHHRTALLEEVSEVTIREDSDFSKQN